MCWYVLAFTLCCCFSVKVDVTQSYMSPLMGRDVINWELVGPRQITHWLKIASRDFNIAFDFWYRFAVKIFNCLKIPNGSCCFFIICPVQKGSKQNILDSSWVQASTTSKSSVARWEWHSGTEQQQCVKEHGRFLREMWVEERGWELVRIEWGKMGHYDEKSRERDRNWGTRHKATAIAIVLESKKMDSLALLLFCQLLNQCATSSVVRETYTTLHSETPGGKTKRE